MIARVSYSDLDRCAELIRDSFGTVAEEFDLTEQNCPTNGAFIKAERLQRDYNNACLQIGYFLGGEIVGYVQLEKKGETTYELEKLAVLLGFRHKGCGKELMDYCKVVVSELGGNKITIGIIEENTRLRSWYESYGFVHRGTRKFEHLPFTVGFMEIDI